jgi:hypothetical protein
MQYKYIIEEPVTIPSTENQHVTITTYHCMTATWSWWITSGAQLSPDSGIQIQGVRVPQVNTINPAYSSEYPDATIMKHRCGIR